MKRQIKFRVWDDETMYYNGSYVHEDGCDCIFVGVMNGKMFVEETCNDAFDYGKIKMSCLQDDLIVMQFTGLRDCDMNKIFEGDLIKFNDSIFEIKFQMGRFKALLIGRTDDTQILGVGLWQEALIIGNIYQNPELLKQ